MDKHKWKVQELSIVLCLVVAILFALTFVPGVIRVNTYESYYDTNYYTSALMGNTLLNVLSGMILGCALLPLFVFAIKPSYKSITVGAVMLELAGLFGLSQFVSERMYPPGVYTPLSHLIAVSAVAAAIFSFFLHSKMPFSGNATCISRKKMALYALSIAGVLAMCFLKWCWKWKYSEGDTVLVNCFEASGLYCIFAMIMTAIALNIAILHAIGLIKGPPICCAALLLGAGSIMIVRILLSYVSSRPIYNHCIPLPLVFLVAVAQITISTCLLVGKRRLYRNIFI